MKQWNRLKMIDTLQDPDSAEFYAFQRLAGTDHGRKAAPGDSLEE
jgi:hypothetical protein